MTGTGVPILDKRRIQNAIEAGEASGRCVLLLGQFNVGLCVRCLTVTGPVTLAGLGDPTGPSPNARNLTVVSALGGRGLLDVNEPPDAPHGVVEIRDIWWRGIGCQRVVDQQLLRRLRPAPPQPHH